MAFYGCRTGFVLLGVAAVAGLAILHVFFDLGLDAAVGLLGSGADLVPDIDRRILDALAGRFHVRLEFLLGVLLVCVRGAGRRGSEGSQCCHGADQSQTIFQMSSPSLHSMFIGCSRAPCVYDRRSSEEFPGRVPPNGGTSVSSSIAQVASAVRQTEPPRYAPHWHAMPANS